MTAVRHAAVLRLDGSIPAYRRATRRSRSQGSAHRSTMKVNPAVLAAALRLAEGDPGRLVLHEDGSVSVVNHSRKHHQP